MNSNDKRKQVVQGAREVLDSPLGAHGFVFRGRQENTEHCYTRKLDGVVQRIALNIALSPIGRPDYWAAFGPQIVLRVPDLDYLYHDWTLSKNFEPLEQAFARELVIRLQLGTSQNLYIPDEKDVKIVAEKLLKSVEECTIPLLDNLSSLSQLSSSEALCDFMLYGTVLRAAAAYHTLDAKNFMVAKNSLLLLLGGPNIAFPGISSAHLKP